MAEEVFIPQLGQTVEEVTIVGWYVKNGDAVKQGQEILEVETDKAVFDVEATADGTIHFGPHKIGDVVPVLTVVATIGEPDEIFADGSKETKSTQVDESARVDVEELFIPQLGQTVEEVKLVNWTVKDGDPVKQGQEVLEVETDKAVFDIEATADGYIHFGPHKIGDVMPVLTVVAVIGGKDAVFPAKIGLVTKNSDVSPKADEIAAKPSALDSQQKESREFKGEKLIASPRAKKLATAKGVDLAQITPTGGNGIRITETDVAAFLESAAPQKAILPDAEVSRIIPLKGVRGLIADRMSASAHTTARVTLFMDVDATAFSSLREKLKSEKEAEWGFKPGYNELLARVCADALSEFPYMNARINGSQIEQLSQINIGIAVDADRGLYVPVIPDVNKKSLREVGAEFRLRVDEIQGGKILPESLSGGTFTITNLGMYDVDGFTPVINLPEAAILGVGRIVEKAVAIEGKVQVRKMMVLSLAFDHRLVDGAPAAKFLQYIKGLIEQPDEDKLLN